MANRNEKNTGEFDVANLENATNDQFEMLSKELIDIEKQQKIKSSNKTKSKLKILGKKVLTKKEVGSANISAMTSIYMKNIKSIVNNKNISKSFNQFRRKTNTPIVVKGGKEYFSYRVILKQIENIFPKNKMKADKIKNIFKIFFQKLSVMDIYTLIEKPKFLIKKAHKEGKSDIEIKKRLEKYFKKNIAIKKLDKIVKNMKNNKLFTLKKNLKTPQNLNTSILSKIATNHNMSVRRVEKLYSQSKAIQGEYKKLTNRLN